MKRDKESSLQPDPAKQYRRTFTRQIIISILIGVGTFFLVILVLFPWFINFLKQQSIPGFENISFDSFSGLVTLAVIAGGFLFWIIDRRQEELAEAEQKKSLSFQLFQTIHDRLVNPEQEAARRWILQNIPIKPTEQPLEEWFLQISGIIEAKPAGWQQSRSPGQIHIKNVLNNFDFIGFVSEHFWRARESDIEWISPPVAKVWERLGPYVKHLSDLRNEPDYYRAASNFGEYCIRWREEKGLPPSRYVKGL